MNVELVTHNPTGTISGIGRYVRELHEGLAQRNVPVQIVRPIAPPLTKFFSFLYHLPLGLENHQPGSLVHFTQIMGCAQMLWHPVRPAVATVHDLGVLVCPEDEQLFNRFDRFILNLQLAGLKRMNHFIIHSEFTRDGLSEHLGIPKEKTTVVPTWINTSHFRPISFARKVLAENNHFSFCDDTIYLLYIGSELPRKNLGVLLEAVAILKARGCLVHFIKVGPSGGQQWRDQFQRQIERLQLSDSISIVNFVEESDLPLFINAADICVTATLLESTFAWVALAALACAKPAIVSPAALIPEELDTFVTTVSRTDADAFVHAIENYITNKEIRARRAREGRELMEMSYDGRLTTQMIVEVYQHVYHQCSI